MTTILKNKIASILKVQDNQEISFHRFDCGGGRITVTNCVATAEQLAEIQRIPKVIYPKNDFTFGIMCIGRKPGEKTPCVSIII
jgi:hypothetical protein